MKRQNAREGNSLVREVGYNDCRNEELPLRFFLRAQLKLSMFSLS